MLWNGLRKDPLQEFPLTRVLALLQLYYYNFKRVFFTNDFNDYFECEFGNFTESKTVAITNPFPIVPEINISFTNVIYRFPIDELTIEIIRKETVVKITVKGCLTKLQLCHLVSQPYDDNLHFKFTGHEIVFNSTILTCYDHPFVKNHLDESSNNKDVVLEVLTFAGTLVSLVCLFITIAIYSLTPKLRTLPGMLLLNYMLLLALAQMTFQWNGNFVKFLVFCKVVGAVQHFSWLATFTSMTVFAHKLFKTFTTCNTTTNGTQFRKKTYILYSAASLGIPAIFVAVCVFLDVFTSLFCYGGQESCWISTHCTLGILHMFASPVLALVTINAIFFFRSMYALRTTFREGQMAVGEQNRRRQILAVYFRLFLMTGLAWLLGFLPPLTSIGGFWYPFVVLNSIQGVYVFLAFGLSAQARAAVADNLRKVFNCIENESSNIQMDRY